MMENSDEDDFFPSHDRIVPQSGVSALFQSDTEKGIRRLCCELLDLKDSVETLHGNTRMKFFAFLRMSDEVSEIEHELIELRRHASAQRLLIQELISGVCHELDRWRDMNVHHHHNPSIGAEDEEESPQISTAMDDIELLLFEHRMHEATDAIEAARRPDHGPISESSVLSRYGDTLEQQLADTACRPSISIPELRKTVDCLIRLGRPALGHQLLVDSYAANLKCRIGAFLPSLSASPKTCSVTLSRLVFSALSSAVRESDAAFAGDPVYRNRAVQWAESELERYIRLARDNAPPPDTIPGLRAASVCVQTTLTGAASVLPQLSALLVVLLRPYVDEALERNFRRAASALDPAAEDFLFVVKELIEQVTPPVVLNFGGTVLKNVEWLFGRYLDVVMKACGDDGMDEVVDDRPLAMVGMACAAAEGLSPELLPGFWVRRKSGFDEFFVPVSDGVMELKEWRRRLAHACDPLRDHFCRHFILNFVYSADGKTQFDAGLYSGGEDARAGPFFPSPPFQALFGKIREFAYVASVVLVGREKMQKSLLARITETLLLWLSDERDFWSVLEHESATLHSSGLHQMILDMHFVVEIARFAGCPSRHLHEIARSIIVRAIRAFSARSVGVDSVDPEDERFVELAKAAVTRLLVGGASASDTDDENVIPRGDDDDDLVAVDSDSSFSSSSRSFDSFASASMRDLDCPQFSDSECDNRPS